MVLNLFNPQKFYIKQVLGDLSFGLTLGVYFWPSSFGNFYAAFGLNKNTVEINFFKLWLTAKLMSFVGIIHAFILPQLSGGPDIGELGPL